MQLRPNPKPPVADRQVVPCREAPDPQIFGLHMLAALGQDDRRLDLVVEFLHARFRLHVAVGPDHGLRHDQKAPRRQAPALVFVKMVLGKFLPGNRLEGVDCVRCDIGAERDDPAATVG